MLITLYTLVVLKDLGLDPASKQARKMIGRVDKRLVFKPAQQPALPSRRNGALHQRQNPRHRLVFQRTERRTGQSTPGRAARRWRLELRSTQKPALFLPYHHLRARRTARIRTSRTQIGGRHQGPQEGRKLPARSPHVPLASNRRSHRQTLAPLLVPGVLALRRFARSRLSAECRNQTRQPRRVRPSKS